MTRIPIDLPSDDDDASTLDAAPAEAEPVDTEPLDTELVDTELVDTEPLDIEPLARATADRADDDAVVADAIRDIADVPAVEIITTAAVHLMSAAAVKCGLADDPDSQTDLDEARKLITALAGLITAAAPDVSDAHARPLRDGLRSLQLAFREASPIPDPIGRGPGEKWTGPVT